MLNSHFLDFYFFFRLSSGNRLQLFYFSRKRLTVFFDRTSEIRVIDLFLMLEKIH